MLVHYNDVTMNAMANHQPQDCLLNRSFRRRSRKTSKPHVTGLCVGNSPVTGEFPAQRAGDAENVSIWWRHHVLVIGGGHGEANGYGSGNIGVGVGIGCWCGWQWSCLVASEVEVVTIIFVLCALHFVFWCLTASIMGASWLKWYIYIYNGDFISEWRE